MTSSAKPLIALAIAASFAITPVAGVTAAAAADALPQPVEDALTAALMDEYHAEAFYSAVLDRFGQVRPFANIIRAEQNHARIIATLMTTYGMTVPENPLLDSPDIAAAVPATLGAACSVGVEAESENAALYDDMLLPAVAGYADITAALEHLRDASQNMHLPAFQRCAS
jgi:hypothetical protein